MLEKSLRWLAEIGRPVNSVTKLFFRPRHPASQFMAEQRAEGGAEEAGAVVTPTENGVADLTIAKTFTVLVTADVKADTSAAVVGFNLHFKTLAKAAIMGLFKR